MAGRGWCASPKIVEISRILKGRSRPAVTDFSFSETDRGFGRVGVSLRALPYGMLTKVGPARLSGLVSGRYSD